MSSEFTVFIVDDAEFSRGLLESALRKEYRVETFATAEECLARLNQPDCTPSIFLLDVDLPVMDGYTLCRQIKARPDIDKIPVVFVSGLDDLESRLEGFDAGGVDFLVKPCNLIELRQKIGEACRVSAEHASLKAQVLESETLTSLVLSSLDEYAILINYLRLLNECNNPRAVVDKLFGLLRAYRLQSAIQLRMPDLEVTVSENGENHPLEVAIIGHVRDMDCIFEFKKRAAFNFEHITILINNVPLHDPDLCGRIRDNVAIAAESANARLLALRTSAENARAKGGVLGLFEALKIAVQNFEKKYALARYRGSSLALDMHNELTSAFTFLGMTEEQELYIQDIVRAKAESLTEIYDFSTETQSTLNNIALQLIGILNSSTNSDLQGTDLTEHIVQPVGDRNTALVFSSTTC